MTRKQGHETPPNRDTPELPDNTTRSNTAHTTSLLRSWGCWVLIGALFLGLHVFSVGLLVFRSDDSFQYCSVTDNILRGNGLSTSIVHFDEQYHCGTIPAPQTVFPSGYSLAMAAMVASGVPMSHAGFVVSLASYWILLLLMLLAARMLQLPTIATRVIMLLFVANWAVCRSATSVLTESLFTTIVFAAFLVLAYAEIRRSKASTYFGLLLVGSLLAAASYWVRQAGLFTVAAIGLYYFGKLCLRRDRVSLISCVLFGGVTGTSIMIGFVRNHILGGSWMGQSSKPVDNPIVGTLFRLGRALFQFLFANTWHPDFYTPITPARALVLAMPIIIIAASMLALVLFVRQRPRWLVENLSRPLPVLLICYLVVYGALLAYCGKTTMISLAPRMFLPVFPGALLLIGCLFPRPQQPTDTTNRSTVIATLLGMMLVGYVFSHGIAHNIYLARNSRPDPAKRIAQWLSEPSHDGTLVSQWVDANIPTTERVMALPGQSTLHTLNRSGVSICRRWFSERDWNEARFLHVSRHYGIRYLIVFPHHRQSLILADDSPLIRGLFEGRTPPWMSIVVQTKNCLVVRITPPANRKE